MQLAENSSNSIQLPIMMSFLFYNVLKHRLEGEQGTASEGYEWEKFLLGGCYCPYYEISEGGIFASSFAKRRPLFSYQ